MGRREGGRRGGREVPGLAVALIDRCRQLDRFHSPTGCHWCRQVAELRAGRPVQVDADALHDHVPHELLGCSGPFTHDSQARFIVTGDRWERLEDE